MPRIGIVTTRPSFFTAADPDRDCTPLVAALRGLGAEAESVIWRDEDVDWSAYDLLVLRSPWDWAEQPAVFTAWLDRVGALTRVLNPPELVRWNMDKRYLEELAVAGVAGVPTVFAADGTVMVQPEVPELSEGREKALYTIDGSFTHAIAKGALLERGGGLRGGVYQETPERVEATAAERDFAELALTAIAQVAGLDHPPLYARIDTVDSAELGLVLLEAELFEPTFNLHLAPEVVDAFAAAILARA